MKPQDVVFLLFSLILVYRRKPFELTAAGIISLVLAVPLFAGWVFFTAERLTWYAGAFFLGSVILSLTHPHTVK